MGDFFSNLGGTLFGGAGTDAADSMSGMAGTVARRANALYRDYQDYYQGLVRRIPGQAEVPLSSYSNEAANAVGANFDRTRGMAERNMGRVGINPASGRWQGLMAGLARNEAANRAGAMTAARGTGRNENWARQMQAGGLGLQMLGMGQSALGQAAGLTGQAGTLAMAGQDQQYGRMTDLATLLAAFGMAVAKPAAAPAAGGGWSTPTFTA